MKSSQLANLSPMWLLVRIFKCSSAQKVFYFERPEVLSNFNAFPAESCWQQNSKHIPAQPAFVFLIWESLSGIASFSSPWIHLTCVLVWLQIKDIRDCIYSRLHPDEDLSSSVNAKAINLEIFFLLFLSSAWQFGRQRWQCSARQSCLIKCEEWLRNQSRRGIFHLTGLTSFFTLLIDAAFALFFVSSALLWLSRGEAQDSFPFIKFGTVSTQANLPHSNGLIDLKDY